MEVNIKSRVSWDVTPCSIISEVGHSTLLRKVCIFYKTPCLCNPGGCKFIFVIVEINYIVAYRYVARQRPRKKRVQPLLFNRRINKRPFLSNNSVNMSPRKQHNRTIQLQWKKGRFLLDPPRGYIARTPDRLRSSSVGYSQDSNDVRARSLFKYFLCRFIS